MASLAARCTLARRPASAVAADRRATSASACTGGVTPSAKAARSTPASAGLKSLAASRWEGGRWSLQQLGAPRAARVQATRGPVAVRADAVPAKSVSLVLLAGGVGKRMGANMPKQYLPLLGKPIALYSLETMSKMAEFKEVVVVCDPSYKDVFEGADCPLPMKFALPGAERQDSVSNGLTEISEDSSLVCIHDSARPLVTVEEVLQVLGDAMEVGAAVLGVQCKATVKEATDDGMVVKTLDRSKLWEMHTPQVIRPQVLRDGFKLVAEKGLEVTDDVSIVEQMGLPVRITKGSYENLKVTTPEDLLIAERLLGERQAA